MSDNEGNNSKGGTKDWFLSKRNKRKTVCITVEEEAEIVKQLEEFLDTLQKTNVTRETK